MKAELVGDFTKEELLQLPNTISIVRRVAGGPSGSTIDGHFGIGLYVAFKKLIDIGDMGCLSVGIPGVGKTASMLAMKPMLHKKLYDSDKTLAAIGGSGKPKKAKAGDAMIEEMTGDQEYFNNSSVLWMSYDFSRLSDMHQVNMLKIVCALLTEHEIKAGTMSYDLSISNCRLSWLGACAYEAYGDLWLSNYWRGNFRDRIVRFHQMVYKRPVVTEGPPEPHITLNFPSIDSVRLEEMHGYHEVTRMFKSQFTDERAPMWASRIGRASAALNHRNYTTMADWKFLSLFRFNFEVERMVGWRERMTSPLQIDTDALQILSEVMKAGRMDEEELAEKYLVRDGEQYQQTIKECMGTLIERGPGGKLVPAEVLMHDYVLPQSAFEIFCLQRGKEFYENGGIGK